MTTLRDHIQANYGPADEVWFDCSECGGEGFVEGECTCGDDCCCCLEPDEPTCGHCSGRGGWWVANGREVSGTGGVSANPKEE